MNKEESPLSEISAALKRTPGAIKSRLALLSKRKSNEESPAKTSSSKKAADRNQQETKPVIESAADPVDSVHIDSAEEDEKMKSENAKSQSDSTESGSVPGWTPMVFTQMEVKVKKPGSTVLVHDESWSSGTAKVDFKYPNGKGTVYSGWKWKFTAKGQPTGEDALQAMASQIQDLQRQLMDQEAELQELRQMRENQMALFDEFHKGMENLKISMDNE